MPRRPTAVDVRRGEIHPSRRSDHAAARAALLHVAEMMRPRWPKLADFIIDSEVDVLAYRPSPASTEPSCTHQSLRASQQRGQAAGRCLGIFPNEEAIIRFIGAVLLEANDDWQLQHRYMQIDGMAELTVPLTDSPLMQIPPQAA